MSELTIKSNFARDKVIMLDGLHPLKFDGKGEASCPAHMREAVERLMASRPGRFWLVEEPVRDITGGPEADEAAFLAELDALREATEAEEVELELEVPEEIDQSFLAEEKPEPLKKRGRKKSRSDEEE